MLTRESLEAFYGNRAIAVAGASLKQNKFGNDIMKELRKSGYTMYAVHPEAVNVPDFYQDFQSFPEKVNALVICTKGEKTSGIVRNALDAGIENIWIQQGAVSPEAIQFCKDKGVNCISGECVLMYAHKSGFPHNLHRWIWQFIGKAPK